MPDEVRPTPVACEGDLRDMYPQVSQLARDKALPRLDGHCRRFIAMSPFLCLGTSRPDGAAVKCDGGAWHGPGSGCQS